MKYISLKNQKHPHVSRPETKFRMMLHEIIFEADTKAGKLFDVMLIMSILLSVSIVMLDSVHAINIVYGDLLNKLEWVFTILFTVEYFLRIYCIGRPVRYMTSFFGIVDLLAILPTFLSCQKSCCRIIR